MALNETDKRASRANTVVIAGYATSTILLFIAIGNAWQSASNYRRADEIEAQVATSTTTHSFIYEPAHGENPQQKVTEVRSAADFNLIIFIITSLLMLAGFGATGYLYRRDKLREQQEAGGKRRIGEWLFKEVLIALALWVLIGLSAFTMLLPDNEGRYEISHIAVNITPKDFEAKYGFELGTQPELFVIIKHNGKTILDTTHTKAPVESHTLTYSTSFEINWKHSDELIVEVRDNDFIGSKVLMKGGGAKSTIFLPSGTYQSKGESSISFTSRFLGE